MGNKVILPIQQAVTIDGHKVFTADETLGGVCFLMNVANADLKYYGSHIGDGIYDFGVVPDGNYKLYKDAETPVTKWHGSGDDGRWIGDDSLPYLPLGNDAGNNWDAKNKRLFNIADPVSDIDVGDRGYNDGRYANKTTTETSLNNLNQTITNGLAGKVNKTGDESIDGAKTFLVLPRHSHEVGGNDVVDNPTEDAQLTPKKYVDAKANTATADCVKKNGASQIVNAELRFGVASGIGTDDGAESTGLLPKIEVLTYESFGQNHIVNKKFVEDAINKALLNLTIPTASYVQPLNIIKFSPLYLKSTAQYTPSWQGALGRAYTYLTANPNGRFIIELESLGNNNAHIIPEQLRDQGNNLLLLELPEKVHIKGVNPGIKLFLHNLDITVAADTSIIENVQLIISDDDSNSIALAGRTFRNCKFIKAGSNQSPLGLTSCKFEGLNEFHGITATLNDCSGVKVYSSGELTTNNNYPVESIL